MGKQAHGDIPLRGLIQRQASVGYAVRHAAGGQVALDGGENFAGEMGAEFVVGVAANQARRFSSGWRPAR